MTNTGSVVLISAVPRTRPCSVVYDFISVAEIQYPDKKHLREKVFIWLAAQHNSPLLQGSRGGGVTEASHGAPHRKQRKSGACACLSVLGLTSPLFPSSGRAA